MSSKAQKKTTEAHNSKPTLADTLLKIGVGLIVASIVLFIVVFYPAIKGEISYFFTPRDLEIEFNRNSDLVNLINPEEKAKITPLDTEFGIVVPKIAANASVIKNVDPFNSKEYQVALTKGVAHAKGSSLPDEQGNVFLFAHSSDNFYNANRYNSVFYLLNKLINDDAFYILYEHKLYKYKVFEKAIVDPSKVEYITNSTTDQQATLMTCWPPGTTIQRLIIKGNLESINHAPRD